MADTNVAPSYRWGELLWNPNLIYDEIVNFDVTKLPYAKGKDNRWYSITKRKWYVIDVFSATTASDRRWTSDIKRVSKNTCGTGWYDLYMYQVTPDRTKYRVIKKVWWTPDNYQILNSWSRCVCTYDRFFQFPFISWDAVEFTTWWGDQSVWVASQEWWDRIYDNNIDLSSVNIWDYIVVYGSINSTWDGIIWQVREIVGKWTVDPDIDKSWYNTYIQLWLPLTNFPSETTFAEWLQYKIYPEFKSTIWYTSAEWIHVISMQESVGNIGNSPSLWQVCIESVQVYDNRINYFTETGFNFFGWQGFDILSFNSDNTNDFWQWTLSTFAYNNFLLAFWKDSIKYSVSAEWDQLSFTISDEVGIKSKYAYWLIDNNILVMTRDNRLAFLGLKWDGSKIYLERQPINDFIRHHLDNMKEDDEVFIHEWDNNIYIFITTKSYPQNIRNDMTKVLILDKDFQLRHHHEICHSVLTWVKNGYFFGDWLYGYFGDRDFTLDGVNQALEYEIKSRISAYIGEQHNNDLTSSEWNHYRLMMKKGLKWIKFLLGSGIYTDWNTKIKIDTYRDWYKYEKLYDTVEWVEWVDNWNDYYKWETITPSECFVDDMEECDNIERDCEWAIYNDQDIQPHDDPFIYLYDNWTNFDYPIDEVRWDLPKIPDYCVCYDSRAYALSPFYNLYLFPKTKPADLYKITLYSEGYDRINFMWMVAEFMVEEIDQAMDWVNIIWWDCNTETKKCPVDWC